MAIDPNLCSQLRKKRTVIVTGGGTREFMDDIRFVTNSATGELAARIIEILFRQEGYDLTVYYLHGKRAAMPAGDFGDRLRLVPIEDVASLEQAVRDIMGKEQVDYFVHTMAVSDFKTRLTTTVPLMEQAIGDIFEEHLDPQELEQRIKEVIRNPPTLPDEGKISSDAELVTYFDRTVKVLKLIKLLQPWTFLVGFKLLSPRSKDDLFARSFGLMRTERCNLVFGNVLRKGPQEAICVYPEKAYQKITGKVEIAQHLVQTMLMRGETRHSRSVLQGDFELPPGVFEQFQRAGVWLYGQGFLPEVSNRDGGIGTYGNMSVRLGDQFCITGRNVHKGHLDEQDLCLVEAVRDVDEASVYANVCYRGRHKASIDTVIHWRIYQELQELGSDWQAIIHVHTNRIFPGYGLTASNQPCGTEGECDMVLQALRNDPDSDIIQMYRHGLIVLGRNLEDCRQKIATLFQEEVSIDNYDPDDASHQAVSAEWEGHYREMHPRTSPLRMDYNSNAYVVQKGGEAVGIVFVEKEGEDLKFVLYTTVASRQRHLGIGQKIIAVLALLARNLGAQNLLVVTKQECGVADYYLDKQGFTQVENAAEDQELIYLKKPI